MYWAYAFLLIFAIFCAWNWVEMKLKGAKEDKEEESFWERERKANSTRRKPLDNLEYITIPTDLPFDVLSDNPELTAYVNTVKKLSSEKILNLTGYTNTDLKLEYGAPNITELSLYDQNYTTMVTSMQKWAEILEKNGCMEDSVKILEFMVSTKVDISKTYKTLAQYYIANGDSQKFEALLDTAAELKSMNTKYLVRDLEEMKKEYDNLI